MLLAPEPAPDSTVVPVHDSPAHAAQQLDTLLANVSRAATLGVQVYPSVVTARFEILGATGTLDLTVTLAVRPDSEAQRIFDEVRHEVVPGLETIIGESFRSVDLDFTMVDATHTAAQSALATHAA